ncbi:hydrogenase maturation protease [Gammaproteobacteria bacterium]
MNPKILVIGVGNPFRHDDGIGPAIIKILQAEDNQDFVLIDGGTDGLALLDQLTGYEEAIIVDAVQMMANPGIVKSFTPAEAKINIKSDVLSTHGLGLAEMLKLVEELNIKTKIRIIGIQPKDISFGEGLSDKIKNQIPEILKLIKQKNT